MAACRAANRTRCSCSRKGGRVCDALDPACGGDCVPGGVGLTLLADAEGSLVYRIDDAGGRGRGEGGGGSGGRSCEAIGVGRVGGRAAGGDRQRRRGPVLVLNVETGEVKAVSCACRVYDGRADVGQRSVPADGADESPMWLLDADPRTRACCSCLRRRRKEARNEPRHRASGCGDAGGGGGRRRADRDAAFPRHREGGLAYNRAVTASEG